MAAIYVTRGLDSVLAEQVATQLMAHDALGAHARDELGISSTLSARPMQAAFTSAGSFAAGAALPFMHDDLAAQLARTLAMSDAERHGLRSAAMRRVRERYSWDAVTEVYERLLRSLV